MLFNKEFLLDKIDEPIHEKIVGQGRWETTFRIIFEHEGKYYEHHYSQGSTEMQEHSPMEYAPDEIECPEVHLVEKTIKVWEIIK